MSVINSYLGLIAAAMAHTGCSLYLGEVGRGRKKARKGWRDTRKGRTAPAATAVALLYSYTTLLSVPSFLSVSRKNRKSAAPEKYYGRDFMAAGCTH